MKIIALVLLCLISTLGFCKSLSDYSLNHEPTTGFFKTIDKNTDKDHTKLEIKLSNNVYYLNYLNEKNEIIKSGELTKTFNNCFAFLKYNEQRKIERISHKQLGNLPTFCFYKEKASFGKYKNLIIDSSRARFYEVSQNGSQIQH